MLRACNLLTLLLRPSPSVGLRIRLSLSNHARLSEEHLVSVREKPSSVAGLLPVFEAPGLSVPSLSLISLRLASDFQHGDVWLLVLVASAAFS
jgi:hypothetical protein